ncbi:hypothetical protein N657DRAFT_119587 [Parathielavia appendiculata]|uniref:Uncharacterized protein n=1 Tax=Parathielavia appendiculata TaxID=2587402 RepID=A0AAN6Z234_9PEZI|nr:hypothetical protein N657DRAFT_119587 [Parathielavia appendiculata]
MQSIRKRHVIMKPIVFGIAQLGAFEATSSLAASDSARNEARHLLRFRYVMNRSCVACRTYGNLQLLLRHFHGYTDSKIQVQSHGATDHWHLETLLRQTLRLRGGLEAAITKEPHHVPLADSPVLLRTLGQQTVELSVAVSNLKSSIRQLATGTGFLCPGHSVFRLITAHFSQVWTCHTVCPHEQDAYLTFNLHGFQGPVARSHSK